MLKCSTPNLELRREEFIEVASCRIANGDVSSELRPQLSSRGLSATSTFAFQRHGEYHHANTCGSPRIKAHDTDVLRMKVMAGRSRHRQPRGDSLVPAGSSRKEVNAHKHRIIRELEDCHTTLTPIYLRVRRHGDWGWDRTRSGNRDHRRRSNAAHLTSDLRWGSPGQLVAPNMPLSLAGASLTHKGVSLRYVCAPRHARGAAS